MGMFEDREKGFEARHAHAEEARFRARSMAVRRVARWAADLLGLEDVAAYEAEVLRVDLTGADEDALVAKLLDDLRSRTTELEVRERMRVALAEALAHVGRGP